MIAAGVLIVDLEPEGFGHLSEVVSGRLYRPRSEIQILHSGGDVLNVVDTREGVISRFREPFVNPQARAEEILDEAGVERVLIIDKDRLDSLCEAQLKLAMSVDTQTELLWRANDEFFRSPAVTVAPRTVGSVWIRIFDRMKAIGDNWWAVLGAWKGEELYLSLIVKIEGGLVTYVTSADGFGERPPRSRAARLVEMAEAQGPVAVALLCDIGELDRLLVSEDPLVALAELRGSEDVFSVRGLTALLGERS